MLNSIVTHIFLIQADHIKTFCKNGWEWIILTDLAWSTERVCNFIYHYRFCTDNNEFGDFKSFSNQVEYLTREDFSLEFEKAQKDYFFDKNKTLYKIISVVS